MAPAVWWRLGRAPAVIWRWPWSKIAARELPAGATPAPDAPPRLRRLATMGPPDPTGWRRSTAGQCDSALIFVRCAEQDVEVARGDLRIGSIEYAAVVLALGELRNARSCLEGNPHPTLLK